MLWRNQSKYKDNITCVACLCWIPTTDIRVTYHCGLHFCKWGAEAKELRSLTILCVALVPNSSHLRPAYTMMPTCELLCDAGPLLCLAVSEENVGVPGYPKECNITHHGIQEGNIWRVLENIRLQFTVLHHLSEHRISFRWVHRIFLAPGFPFCPFSTPCLLVPRNLVAGLSGPCCFVSG